jgi:hypothetical protein
VAPRPSSVRAPERNNVIYGGGGRGWGGWNGKIGVLIVRVRTCNSSRLFGVGNSVRIGIHV